MQIRTWGFLTSRTWISSPISSMSKFYRHRFLSSMKFHREFREMDSMNRWVSDFGACGAAKAVAAANKGGGGTAQQLWKDATWRWTTWTKMTKTVNNPELSPLSSTFLWFHRPLWSVLFFVAMTRDRDHASLCFIVIQKDLCWKSKSKCLVRPRELPLSSARQLFEWLDTAMFTFLSGSQLVHLAAGMQLTWCWNCNWPVITKWAKKKLSVELKTIYEWPFLNG